MMRLDNPDRGLAALPQYENHVERFNLLVIELWGKEKSESLIGRLPPTQLLGYSPKLRSPCYP